MASIRRLVRTARDYADWGPPAKCNRRSLARDRKYGTEVVALATVRAACADVVQPEALGLE